MEEKQGLKWASIGAIISWLLSMTIIYIKYRIPMSEAVSGVIMLLPLLILPIVSAVIFKWKCSEWPLYFVVTSALEIVLLIQTSPITLNTVVDLHNEMSAMYYVLIFIGMILVSILTMAVGGVIAIVLKIKGVIKSKLSTELNFENDTEYVEIISGQKIDSGSNNKADASIIIKIAKEYCAVALGAIIYCVGGVLCLPLISVLIPIWNSRNSKDIKELKILNYFLLIPFLIILFVLWTYPFKDIEGQLFLRFFAFVFAFIPMTISMAIVEKLKYKKSFPEGEKASAWENISLVNIIALLAVLSVFISYIFI